MQKWIRRLVAFFLGQGSVQILNLLVGFLLVRWLSVAEYAIFSLVAGFQGAAGVLVELGLSGAIIPLLAGRTDPAVVGGYIRATRYYRDVFLFLLTPAIMSAFIALSLRQGIPWAVLMGLLAAILSTLYFQSWVSYYSMPLLVHQKLGDYYRAPVLVGAGRLFSCALMHFANALNAVAAVWLNALSALFHGWIYKRLAVAYISEPRDADGTLRREVLDYIRPLLPSTIFFALQGQISILLISWFGHVRNVAEVGALGRLGQLFLVLAAFNAVIVAPLIARIPKAMLPRRYLEILGGALFVCAVMISFTLLCPQVFLWVIGSKYAHLEDELLLMMAGACVSYITGVMWTMHSARKWVFNWGVWSYIGTVSVTQAIVAGFVDLSATRGVLLLNLFAAIATVIVQAGWGIYGFTAYRNTRTS